jgi:flagellar protein FliO/FliZ
MTFDTIILVIAAALFVSALVALTAWAFKAFFGGGSGRSGTGFLRQRERRLSVVETAAVDARRKLVLVRRDDVEILVMTGGPVDVVLETGIKVRPHLEPPLEDVIIARNDTRPAPEFGKP